MKKILLILLNYLNPINACKRWKNIKTSTDFREDINFYSVQVGLENIVY